MKADYCIKGGIDGVTDLKTGAIHGCNRTPHKEKHYVLLHQYILVVDNTFDILHPFDIYDMWMDIFVATYQIQKK